MTRATVAFRARSASSGRSAAPLWRSRLAAALSALPLAAAALMLGAASPSAHSQAAAASEWADAEVRKVDRDAGKLTLKHGEIKSLDMPPMTMVFVARDKAMLDGLQAGSKIRFRAAKDKGQYTVLELQKAP